MVTRYRITVNGQETWQDDTPSDDVMAALEAHISMVGGHAAIEQVTTSLLPDVPMGLGKIHSKTVTVFEIEG